MNDTAISHYITSRIRANADWYEGKGMILSYQYDSLASDVFLVMNFSSMLALDEGHTVMMVANDGTPSDIKGCFIGRRRYYLLR